MAERRIEDYAYRHNISNSEAKRRLKFGRAKTRSSNLPIRGMPVAGTGKPKGASK